MRFWLGVTDNRWYLHVSAMASPEVNFWQPSARPSFSDPPEDTHSLFKLKAPHHPIAGDGRFVRYRFGRPFLQRARLGHGSFRTLVIDAYQKRWAVTGKHTLPALETAHILPYANQRPHHTSNGLLLRSDFHKLFDAGLVTVEPNLKVRVSGRIRDHYFNGKAYYRLHGQTLATLPSDSANHPDPGFLRWHNENRFVE